MFSSNSVRNGEVLRALVALGDTERAREAFNMLRPNDLIWPYIVNNYIKGKSPSAFDLLYWNTDSTNLPARMHSYYLRHMYLYNELIEKNAPV